ncbi:hypothetical protein WN48_01420 [Eufriesea mexicana]|uniref:Uncharacterized protein n=1 Tax=Eufriesea mexicana TaxID=516756 RepID=A0A310SLB1_9HYME|nr:hypothetical protein WN48_01420 [Eufriesea mexicana]
MSRGHIRGRFVIVNTGITVPYLTLQNQYCFQLLTRLTVYQTKNIGYLVERYMVILTSKEADKILQPIMLTNDITKVAKYPAPETVNFAVAVQWKKLKECGKENTHVTTMREEYETNTEESSCQHAQYRISKTDVYVMPIHGFAI